MERRNFLKLTPALPAAAPMVALSIKQPDGSQIQADVGVLRIKPGDVVVINSTEYLCRDSMERIVAAMKSLLPEGTQCIVLERLSVGVIRPEA